MEIFWSIAGPVILAIVLIGIWYQLNWREPIVPGYLDEWDMMGDLEPDTRSLEERLQEQRRLLKFQGFDVDKTG